MLATQADVESRLQVVFDADPDPIVADLIASAQAHIEAYVGRALESAEHVETYEGNQVAILLEHWPVTDVTAVTVDGAPLTLPDEVSWYSWGRLYRVGTDGLTAGYPRTWDSVKPQPVEVTYTAGYLTGIHDRELKHLSSVCVEVVARAFRQAVDWVARPPGGIQSLALDGSDSITYATGAGGGQVPAKVVGSFLAITDADQAELAGYLSPAVA
jgi:hypothetical protein